jgi:hypothetical protein
MTRVSMHALTLRTRAAKNGRDRTFDGGSDAGAARERCQGRGYTSMTAEDVNRQQGLPCNPAASDGVFSKPLADEGVGSCRPD